MKGRESDTLVCFCYAFWTVLVVEPPFVGGSPCACAGRKESETDKEEKEGERGDGDDGACGRSEYTARIREHATITSPSSCVHVWGCHRKPCKRTALMPPKYAFIPQQTCHSENI